jgi:hypothetical protein
VIALLDVARQLLADVLRFVIVALRPTRIVAAENLFLRRQLAMYVERRVKPRRPDVATRVRLALLFEPHGLTYADLRLLQRAPQLSLRVLR